MSVFFTNLVYDVIYCLSEDVLLGEVRGHVAPVVDEPDLGPRPNIWDRGDPLPQLVAVLLGKDDDGELRVDRDGEVLKGTIHR